MGIIKFNKMEKDKNKKLVMQAKMSDIATEQPETEQVPAKAEKELQSRSIFCDDGFVEEILSEKGTNITAEYPLSFSIQ